MRDGFVSLLPLTFFRVAATLVQQLPWPAYQNWMSGLFGPDWSIRLNQIVSGTNNIFSVALAVFVALHLTERLPQSHDDDLTMLTVGLSALVNFVLFVYVFPLSIDSFGLNSLLLAVFVGIATAELLRWFSRIPRVSFKNLPYDTEVTFYHAMRACVPVIFVGVIAFFAAQMLVGLLPHKTDFAQPFVDFAQLHGHGVWWLSILATLINHVLWFIGFHGGLMMDAYFSNLFAPVYSETLAWRPMLDNFVLIGGAGATMGMLLAIVFVAKDGVQRQIAKISALPSLFNINDILLYGLPIILNPFYLIPFITVPLMLTLITISAAQFGFVTFAGTPISWTTPPLISGWLLTGSWHGVALQAVEIAISTLIYIPFVRRAEAARKLQQQQAFDEVKNFLMAENRMRVSAIRMQGQVGIIARGLLADLRQDIKRDNLNLAYQPKHDKNGKIVGVEALLRWKNNKHGHLPPPVAVTLAEDSGDIHPLGEWVLEEACACKARWNALGYKSLVIAINVSPEQLKNPDLPQTLVDCLRKHNLKASEIELEITESSVIPDTQEVDKTLQQLSESGVRIAMDDFGMGYSSLLYLRRIRVHTIKIDGSLTRDVLINSTNADIIRTIAALGKSQKVDVVAEFVENEQQLHALVQMGCNMLQGYLFSPPLTEAGCVEYFQQHAKH